MVSFLPFKKIFAVTLFFKTLSRQCLKQSDLLFMMVLKWVLLCSMKNGGKRLTQFSFSAFTTLKKILHEN